MIIVAYPQSIVWGLSDLMHGTHWALKLVSAQTNIAVFFLQSYQAPGNIQISKTQEWQTHLMKHKTGQNRHFFLKVQRWLPEETAQRGKGKRPRARASPLQISVSTPANAYNNGCLVGLAVRIKWASAKQGWAGHGLWAPSTHGLLRGKRSLFANKTRRVQTSGAAGSYILEIDSLHAQSSGRIIPRCELTLLTAQLLLIFTASHEIECCAHCTGAEPELRELEKQAPPMRKD